MAITDDALQLGGQLSGKTGVTACTVAFLQRLSSVTQSCTARKTLALFGDEKLFISTTRAEVAASKIGA